MYVYIFFVIPEGKIKTAVGLDRSLLNARRWISTNCCLSTDVKRKNILLRGYIVCYVNCVSKFCFISSEYKIWQTIMYKIFHQPNTSIN